MHLPIVERFPPHVLPHLDYCSTVWHTCNQTLSQSLERSQNYAMRVILNQPPRTRSASLRDQLHWTTLHQRRHNQMLCQVHRCLLRQAPVYLTSKFVRNSYLYSSTRGANKLHIPYPRTNKFRLSFEYQGAYHYNQLPQDVRSKQSLSSFKHALMTL